MAILGLALSVIGIVLAIVGFSPDTWFLTIPAFILAIAGLILSIMGGNTLKKQGKPNGIAIAALVIGIVAVVLTTITFFACGIPGMRLS